jgi:thymidylate kinase
MIVLRVDPELAIRRKASEPQKHVSARASELWNTDWSDTYAKIVDANRSKDEVANTVRSLVWAEL